MSAVGIFFSYAMLAVFAQNVLFSGAAGISDALEVCSKPRERLLTSALVSLFSFFGTLVTVPFMLIFSFEMKYILLYGLVLSLGVLIAYFLCARLVVRLENVRERLGPYLAPSAINGAVLALPLAAVFSQETSVAVLLGSSLGSGVGFFFASLLVAAGVRASKSPFIPKPLRGIPAVLIYIGIISLSMSVLTGTIQFN